MIKKGYHYIVDCDVKGCTISYVVGVARHNFDARRQSKQKLIKEGWTPGQFGTFICPECNLKQEKRNVDSQAEAKTEAPAPVKEAITALQEVRGV